VALGVVGSGSRNNADPVCGIGLRVRIGRLSPLVLFVGQYSAGLDRRLSPGCTATMDPLQLENLCHPHGDQRISLSARISGCRLRVRAKDALAIRVSLETSGDGNDGKRSFGG